MPNKNTPLLASPTNLTKIYGSLPSVTQSSVAPVDETDCLRSDIFCNTNSDEKLPTKLSKWGFYGVAVPVKLITVVPLTVAVCLIPGIGGCDLCHGDTQELGLSAATGLGYVAGAPVGAVCGLLGCVGELFKPSTVKMDVPRSAPAQQTML